MAYSKLMESLQKNDFTISGEVDPPKGANRETIVHQAELLKPHVIAANVTDNPLGIVIMNTLVPCHILQNEVGLEAVYQVTCRDRNRIAIQSDLLGAAALGIPNVLALTGDHPSLGDHPEAKPVFDLGSVELVGLIKRMVDEETDYAGHKLDVAPKMHIGVALSPGIDPIEPEIIKYEKKIKAGAEFAQTQCVYDKRVLEKLLDATSHLDVPIMPGIAPLKSVGMAKFMAANVPGVTVPEDMIEALKDARDVKEATVDITAGLLRDIKELGFPGVHIMPVGMDEYVGEIIRRAGIK
jgi:methylenetetrahydrofolate reductase (NADPH)